MRKVFTHLWQSKNKKMYLWLKVHSVYKGIILWTFDQIGEELLLKYWFYQIFYSRFYSRFYQISPPTVLRRQKIHLKIHNCILFVHLGFSNWLSKSTLIYHIIWIFRLNIINRSFNLENTFWKKIFGGYYGKNIQWTLWKKYPVGTKYSVDIWIPSQN